MLKLLKIIENNWSEKQRYTIWDIMTNGGSQKSCAERLGTTQSTVARRLADGNYITYQKTKTIITKAINTLGEMLFYFFQAYLSTPFTIFLIRDSVTLHTFVFV